jgi:hypothetical protein
MGHLHTHGKLFWGSPHSGPPICDPIPQEVLDKHPDVVTDWMNCDGCGTPLCGRPAPFRVRLTDLDGSNEQTFWLCADHYDEFRDQRDEYLPNWHECLGGRHENQ